MLNMKISHVNYIIAVSQKEVISNTFTVETALHMLVQRIERKQ